MIEDDFTTNVNIYLTNNSNTEYKYIQIAVPINFALRKLYLVKNNLEKFNLTGAIYKVKTNVSMPCPKSKLPSSDSEKYYTMKYDVYMFMSNTPISSNVNVLAEIVYDGKTNLSIEKLTEEELISQYTNNNVSRLINDEEFNNLYWLDADGYNGNDNTELINKLNQTQENGIDKQEH